MGVLFLISEVTLRARTCCGGADPGIAIPAKSLHKAVNPQSNQYSQDSHFTRQYTQASHFSIHKTVTSQVCIYKTVTSQSRRESMHGHVLAAAAPPPASPSPLKGRPPPQGSQYPQDSHLTRQSTSTRQSVHKTVNTQDSQRTQGYLAHKKQQPPSGPP